MVHVGHVDLSGSRRFDGMVQTCQQIRRRVDQRSVQIEYDQWVYHVCLLGDALHDGSKVNINLGARRPHCDRTTG